MALKWRKKIILAKIEDVYGTDAVPTGAVNAIMATNISITPLQADTVARENPRPYLGNFASIHVGAHVAIEFDVEMAGAGSAGGIPAYGCLMRACTEAEINTVGVKTEYKPVSEDEEAVSIYFHFDGQKHALLGCRGDWGFRINAKGLPYIHFKLLGLWVDPASVADPTTTLTAFKDPLPVSKVNTPTFTVHGYAAKVQSFEYTKNNAVGHRDLIGVEEIAVTDRAPGATLVLEAPALSAKNFFTIAKGETLGAVQLIHGTTAGNKIQFDAPSAQVNGVSYSEADGNIMLSLDLAFIPVNGDDETVFTAS